MQIDVCLDLDYDYLYVLTHILIDEIELNTQL